jgi:HSP20 family protein
VSDISSTDPNRGARSTRENFENQRQELKEKYDSELEKLRAEQSRKLKHEEKSGEAAVNHIQERNKYKIEKAQAEVAEREKIVDAQLNQKQENLKRRYEVQDEHLDETKEKYGKWHDTQIKEIHAQKEQVKDQTNSQLKSLTESQQKRLREAEKKVAQQNQEVSEKGRERISNLRANYEQRIQDLEDKEIKRYHQVRDSYSKQRAAETASFKDAMVKEKEGHAREIGRIHEKQSGDQKVLKAKTHETLEQERNLSEKRIRETKSGNQAQLKLERDRFAATENKMMEDHSKELKRLEDETRAEMNGSRSKLEQDKKIQEEEFNRQTQQLKERHELQRKNLIQIQLKERETAELAHQQRLGGQLERFEEKFSKNDQMARSAYTNQAVNLSKELYNQKNKFIKLADKYKDKDGDPFYQIRDSRTKLSESGNAYVFEARIPEHEKGNVDVRVKNNKIILSGNRSFNDQISEGGRTVQTNNVQTYHEHYDIPMRVKENEVVKTYEDGVLKVVIPKVTS